jgi:chaperonin cofactor prefoldin
LFFCCWLREEHEEPLTELEIDFKKIYKQLAVCLREERMIDEDLLNLQSAIPG